MSGLQVPSRVLARLKEAEEPPKSRRVALGAGVLAVVLGLVGFAAWRMQPEEPKVLAPVAAPLPLETEPTEEPDAPVDAALTDRAVDTTTMTATTAVATNATPNEATEQPPRRARPRTRRRLPRITTQPLAPTPAPSATATGEVRLSGPSELWGARVMVRGRQVAIVPGSVALPAGTHELRIERPNGPAIVRRVTVREGTVERVVVRP
jgi:hypothetical protein